MFDRHPVPPGAPSAAARALQFGEHALFALLLFIGVTQAAANGDLTGPLIGLVAAFTVWYVLGAVFAARMPKRWVAPLWFAVLAALWVAAAIHAPSLAWLAFALCLLALHLLPWVPGVITVFMVTGMAIIVLWPTASSPVSAVLGPVIGAFVTLGITVGYSMILKESAARGQLLEELSAAQADLVAVQEELATAQRDAGALAERARLARDIHDTLAQGYSSILLLSRAELATEPPNAALLAQIEQLAGENLVEARRVVHALSPAQLDEAPLPQAVRRLLDRLAAESGIRADLEVSGDPRLSSMSVDVAVLRLVQGALANVRQHADADRVVVSLAYEPTELLIDVVDDGVGFDPAVPPLAGDAGGFGLRALRERVAQLGGRLSVESRPGEGAAVAASIPLDGGGR
ncbi:sensor histidine kinase [Propioniciclava coleopterorum]|uniref:sensor histidine kinase n=1 Tax=Propioniciclava coleopterorum TaxID=2714937 RepID=UPI00197F2785|nr:sensor histidine kinase [Propioniciclava coleopterorum]